MLSGGAEAMRRGHYTHDQVVVPKRRVHVVAAVIYNEENRIFLSRRPSYVDQGGLWEFPGGKLHANETSLEALKRELSEELGIQVERAQPLIKITHEYAEKHILLDVWEVRHYRGDPYGREGQVVRWVPEKDLARYNFPEANVAVIKAAMLPHSYMVTADEDDEERFVETFSQALKKHSPDLVRLRAPSLSASAYAARAKTAMELCKGTETRLMLGHHASEVGMLAELVEGLGACGLHLSQQQLLQQSERPIEHTHLLAASTHSVETLVKAEGIGCDFALMSCIKETSSHPDVQPIGWNGFQQAIAGVHIPVFALGGLSLTDVDRARAVGGQGIAAISAFYS